MNEKRKILVIDDEEDLRESIEFQFAAKGYHVTTAVDGVDGLEKLEAVDPDVIILDLNMPRMGGIEFFHKICDENGRPSHPVLILTARANTRQLFLELDVDGFITKPFEIDQVIEEAEIIINKNHARLEATDEDEPLTDIKHICVVEKDPDALNAISLVLLNAGYKVSTASSGTRGLEKMMMDVPDVALVNLGLTDIAGDLAVLRLRRMSKTSDIKNILYTSDAAEIDTSVSEHMQEKTGVEMFLKYKNPQEFLEALRSLQLKEKAA